MFERRHAHRPLVLVIARPLRVSQKSPAGRRTPRASVKIAQTRTMVTSAAEQHLPEGRSCNEEQDHGHERPEHEVQSGARMQTPSRPERSQHDQHVAVAEIGRFAPSPRMERKRIARASRPSSNAERQREKAGARQAHAQRQAGRLPHEEDGGSQQCYRHEDFAEPRRNGARPGALLLRVSDGR